METKIDAWNRAQLVEIASHLPVVSSNTDIKTYYTSSNLLLQKAEKAHHEHNIEEEFLWLMKFVLLIHERIKTHPSWNKSPEAKRLDKVYKSKSAHVLTRLEVLKDQIDQFYIDKRNRIEQEKNKNVESESKINKNEQNTESLKSNDSSAIDPLLARLSRLSDQNNSKKSTPVQKSETKVDKTEQIVEQKEKPIPLDYFDQKPPEVPKEVVEDHKLIPEVECNSSQVDEKDKTHTQTHDSTSELSSPSDLQTAEKPSLDLSWLEEDPIFGSKNRVGSSLSIKPNQSSQIDPNDSSIPNSKSIESSQNQIDHYQSLPDWITSTIRPANVKSLSKPSPPSYSDLNNKASSISSSSSKYIVKTEIDDSKPALNGSKSSSDFSVSNSISGAHSSPSSSVYEGYSFTKTNRGQQFDPTEINKTLQNIVEIRATCLADPLPSTKDIHNNHNHHHNHHHDHNHVVPSVVVPSNVSQISSPSLSSPSSPSSNYSSHPVILKYPSPVSNIDQSLKLPQTSKQVVFNSSSNQSNNQAFSGLSSHLIYQPSPNYQAKIPLLGNVPVVFRPGQLNLFREQTSKIASPSLSSPSIIDQTKDASMISKQETKPNTIGPIHQPKQSSNYQQKQASNQQNQQNNQNNQHKPSSNNTSHQHKQSPKTSVAPARANSNHESAFPLLTNQRAGEAVHDDSLKKIEIDGEIFDQFMERAHKNTSRAIETCGILAGKLKRNQHIFKVTHLIIPKQTGTTDTCATTNEDEIFEFQIKHDLLTLGWIHTHPTQACFLSSVDLHTQASYQSLFAEAIAIVIAPRDVPSFSFFHLSKTGLSTIQNCPRSGFHHHSERGLYEACSHVVLVWASKHPCKLVDMR